MAGDASQGAQGAAFALEDVVPHVSLLDTQSEDGEDARTKAAAYDARTSEALRAALALVAESEGTAMRARDVAVTAVVCACVAVGGSQLFPLSVGAAEELWKRTPTPSHDALDVLARRYAASCGKGGSFASDASDFVPYALGMCAAVEKMKFPHVGASLDAILPPLLRLADHFDVRWKARAFASLCHAVDACNPSDLKWNGRADVLLECLLTHISTRDESLLPHTLRFHSLLLKIIGPPRLLSAAHAPGDYLKDAGVSTVLRDASLEDKIALRKVYARALPNYVGVLGVSTVAHMKRLVPLVVDYLERGPDEEMRVLALNLADAVLRQCWPRVRFHARDFVYGVLAVAIDVCADRSTCEGKQAVWTRSIDVLKLLRSCVGDEAMRPILDELCDGADKLPGLRDVLHAWDV